MGHKEWKIPQKTHKASEGMEKALLTPLLREILIARNIDTPEKMGEYLSKDRSLISDPFLLQDMDKAKARIELALSRGEKTVVYGDYDVDGISSACLLCDFLRGYGLDCDIYIPDRLGEGYGVNVEAITALAQSGIELIITVDCGVTAVYETEHAKRLGIDLIITDHHECPQTLPAAAAVINPKRQASAYPFESLAGVGVAFKLACAVEGRLETVLDRYSDLIALGTIADVMPLCGENRVLAHEGLEKLKKFPRPGLHALLKEAGAEQKPITATSISFVLAPRINAAGRLAQAGISTSLLLTKDEDEAREYAKELCGLNRRRQELEVKVWDEATRRLEGNIPSGPIVLESESWHPGVVGIAASRLAETHRLPVIIICLEGNEGKGSCRSYGGFNIFDAVSACSQYLESFGGHAYAAGFCIKAGNIDIFRSVIAEYYKDNPPTYQARLEPEILIENLEILSLKGVSSLAQLEPCGCGNPRPLMCACDLVVDTATPIGNGKHLRLRMLRGGTYLDCVFFAHSLSELAVSEGMLADICFSAQINDFRASESVQLLLADVRPALSSSVCEKIIMGLDDDIDDYIAFRPDREELIRLWRIIKNTGGLTGCGLEELSRKQDFGGFPLIKLCLGLKIFHELGLAGIELKDDKIFAHIRNGAIKTELEASPLFRLLWENGG